MRSIAILDSMSRHSSGISFILMMEHDVPKRANSYSSGTTRKDYSYHPRFDQPCQGGETRKYGSTHPDCTQPHNSKPGDLHHPFPAGRPSAISFPLSGVEYASADNEAYFNAMFSKNSPWIKGFGSPDNIRLLRNDKNLPYGVIIGVKNLNVDPTVMINCIQMLRNSEGSSFNKLVKDGFTDNEALAVLMLNQGCAGPEVRLTSDYYFCPVFSARRFFGQKPNDLSGGYYSDRTDYNRTYVQDVFLADPEDNGIKWQDAMAAELGLKPDKYGYSPVTAPSTEAFVKAAKAVFAKALENEKPLTNKPYQYRDASGNVLNLKEAPVAPAEDDEDDEDDDGDTGAYDDFEPAEEQEAA